MRRAAALIAAAGLLALPGVASAHRRASGGELRAMVYHASARYYGGLPVNEPRSAPARCFTAVISTERSGSRWGAWTFSRYARQVRNSRRCRTGDGVAVEHRIGNRWYVLWEGSVGYPPTHDVHSGRFLVRAVPRAVSRDLLGALR